MSAEKPQAQRKTFKNERNVKQHVKHLLDKHGWYWWMPPSNGMQQTGIHDFHALKSGVFMTVETKFDGRKPTENQKAFGQSIHAAGGIAMVVDNHTLPLFDVWLQLFDKGVLGVAQAMKDGQPDEVGIDREDGADMLDILKTLTAPLVMKSKRLPVVLADD